MDHGDVSSMNISGLLLPTMTSDLWEARLNMLTPAQASFSDLQLTFLTFQLMRLHIVNPRADKTHIYGFGESKPGNETV